MNPNRTYVGSQGLYEYLRPTAEEYIPLVELPASLNEYLEAYDIHVSVKLMNTLPLGNVKSLPAHCLLGAQDIAGKQVVESSSGNTVFSMGLLAPHMGAKSVHAIASKDVSDGKLNLLRLAGVEIELHDGPICPDANDPDSTIALARRRGAQSGWVNPGQYDNDANPRTHESITGPQLYAQLGDSLGMLVAGLGTTGTLVGTARYLKQKLPTIQVGAAVRVPNNHVPGVRTRHGLNEVAFAWEDLLSEPPVVVNEHTAYLTSLEMIRSGLLVGPSSGFALAAARDLIKQYIEQGKERLLRDKHVVVLCPDSCFPYVEEYFQVLEATHFPVAKDFSSARPEEASSLLADLPEITASELHADFIEGSARHYEIVDVREKREFDDHHIPGSVHVPLYDISAWVEGLRDADKAKRYVFVCSRMQRSARAAYIAQQSNVSAYVLQGGTAAWSKANYARVRPMLCEITHP